MSPSFQLFPPPTCGFKIRPHCVEIRGFCSRKCTSAGIHGFRGAYNASLTLSPARLSEWFFWLPESRYPLSAGFFSKFFWPTLRFTFSGFAADRRSRSSYVPPQPLPCLPIGDKLIFQAQLRICEPADLVIIERSDSLMPSPRTAAFS